MDKTYTRINWENEPSTSTPINETNLNAMDEAIDVIDGRVVAHDTQIASMASIKESAEASAKLSKSYAVGGTNSRSGEDTDNAKYYCQQASTFTPTGYADLVADVETIKSTADYTISTTWVANTTIGDYETYPFKQTISTASYTTNRDCLVLSATPTSMPSATEMEEMAKICQFVDFSNGVTVLASEETTTALTLRVKGV